jgi:hypothetical protein
MGVGGDELVVVERELGIVVDRGEGVVGALWGEGAEEDGLGAEAVNRPEELSGLVVVGEEDEREGRISSGSLLTSS